MAVERTSPLAVSLGQVVVAVRLWVAVSIEVPPVSSPLSGGERCMSAGGISGRIRRHQQEMSSVLARFAPDVSEIVWLDTGSGLLKECRARSLQHRQLVVC